jgi:hypothetical protein
VRRANRALRLTTLNRRSSSSCQQLRHVVVLARYVRPAPEQLRCEGGRDSRHEPAEGPGLLTKGRSHGSRWARVRSAFRGHRQGCPGRGARWCGDAARAHGRVPVAERFVLPHFFDDSEDSPDWCASWSPPSRSRCRALAGAGRRGRASARTGRRQEAGPGPSTIACRSSSPTLSSGGPQAGEVGAAVRSQQTSSPSSSTRWRSSVPWMSASSGNSCSRAQAASARTLRTRHDAAGDASHRTSPRRPSRRRRAPARCAPA